MTEYAHKSNEELASAFIVGTCELIPRPSCFVYSDHMRDLVAPAEYLIVCGSQAEFYIRPLISCIDDVDYLIANAEALAFSGDFPVLPSDRSGLFDTIVCFLIEPYVRYPGFVRLRHWGKMKYNWKLKKYVINHAADTSIYARLPLNDMVDRYQPLAFEWSALPNIVKGPAIKHKSNFNADYLAESDFVTSVWCPQWPKEAQGWLYRPRLSGWPTTDVISEVVQNGCNLVYIQHRSCRNDGRQWRFSFSVAEVILLQSWTQTQQIVYHLLRFFTKKELIQKDCPKEDEVLCTYHLKTLMLWTCEEMSREWWGSASIISICSELLKTLAEWLRKRHCPNYFIPEANLFHDPSTSKIFEETKSRLNVFRNCGFLCHWFEENYIWSFIRRRFKYSKMGGKMPHFVEFMLPLLKFWKFGELESVESYFWDAFSYFHRNNISMKRHGQTSRLRSTCKFQMKCGIKYKGLSAVPNASCIMHHNNLLDILHAAYSLGKEDISWDNRIFVEVIDRVSKKRKDVRSQYHNFPRPFSATSSQSDFIRAQGFMESLTGSNSCSEFEILALMTKQFLRKAVEHDSSEYSGIVPAALSYLAAIHFAALEYKEAKHFCSAVLMDKTPQKDKEILNAGCLLFIDDIARIVGLCVLQKKITESNLHYINNRLYLDLRLSPKVVSRCFSVLFAERMSKQFGFDKESLDSSFPMDVNLRAILNPHCISMKSSSYGIGPRQMVYCRPDSLAETEASILNPTIHVHVAEKKLHDSLMKYALENMTLFYNIIRKDFGVECNTIDCYHALYHYKCGRYDGVFHLCERILKHPDMYSDLTQFSFANVLMMPPLDLFFDRDVQSLLGFHTLFYSLYPLNDDLGKIELTAESTFEHYFARNVYCPKFQLDKPHLAELLALSTPYSFKCNYFLGRHFIAKYLKLRCCIDCNLPYSSPLTEFAHHSNTLPFEHIIRRFLRRKLRV